MYNADLKAVKMHRVDNIRLNDKNFQLKPFLIYLDYIYGSKYLLT